MSEQSVTRLPVIEIGSHNYSDRVDEAVNMIVSRWNDWEADAERCAQSSQSDEAWFVEMINKLRRVLSEMLFDPPTNGECASERAQEDAVEAAHDWLPFALKNHDPSHVRAIRQAFEEGFRAGRMSV